MEHPDKTYPAHRWSQIIAAGYLAFWDSEYKHDEFVITDIGMTSENEKGWNGVTVHNSKKLLFLIDNLRTELENADTLLNNSNAKTKYKLNVTTRIDNLVQTKGFEYSDLRLSLDYAAITDLLMGKNIYGDSKLLQEYIQKFCPDISVVLDQ